MEHVRTFGSEKNLVGIVSTPERWETRRSRLCVIFLNAGLIHKVGPFRLYVDMARELASQGYSALRFDLSGLGDSPFVVDSQSEDHRVMKETSDAMDFATKELGVDRFILMGLCSGADLAYRVALADPRVKGTVLLDGYAYRTRAYYLHALLARLGRWKGYIGRLFRRLRGETPPQPVQEIFERKFPDRRTFRKDLQTLADRDVHSLFVYSGGYAEHYNHQNQFEAMTGGLDTRGRVRHAYFPLADHTYSILADRRQLIRQINEWMNLAFGQEVAPAAETAEASDSIAACLVSDV